MKTNVITLQLITITKLQLQNSYYTQKMMCYFVHTELCCFNKRCVKPLIQHGACVNLTHGLYAIANNTLFHIQLP